MGFGVGAALLGATLTGCPMAAYGGPPPEPEPVTTSGDDETTEGETTAEVEASPEADDGAGEAQRPSQDDTEDGAAVAAYGAPAP